MINLIYQSLYNIIKPESIVGLFFSAFDNQWVLIVSHGVIQTDKPANQLITLIYNGLIAQYEWKIRMIACDIVQEIKQEDDISILLWYNPEQYWLRISTIDGSKSWVLLPQTAGVSDMKSWLLYLKSKYNIEGNVIMWVFTTKRVIV